MIYPACPVASETLLLGFNLVEQFNRAINMETGAETISLSRATLADVPALLEVEKTAVGLKTYSGYYTEKELEDYVQADTVYLIKKGSEVVGSISYEVKAPDRVYLSGLVIKPDFQKQGLARQATAKVLEELKDFAVVDLAVHPDNHSAIKVYASFGFVPKETKENYFGDGEPRLIMVLSK